MVFGLVYKTVCNTTRERLCRTEMMVSWSNKDGYGRTERSRDHELLLMQEQRKEDKEDSHLSKKTFVIVVIVAAAALVENCSYYCEADTN